VEINMSDSIPENTVFLVGFLQHYPGFNNLPTEVFEEMVHLLSYIVPLSDDLSKVYVTIIRGRALLPFLFSLFLFSFFLILTGIGLAKGLAEPALKTTLIQLFLQICEFQTPPAVVKELFAAAKFPKTTSAVIEIVSTIIIDFGIDALDVSQIVTLASQILATTTIVAIKLAVVKMLGELYKRTGPSLRSQLSEIKQAQANAIFKEFDKLANVKPLRPSRTVKSQR
jgi:hypothetical protein